ncbi:hypothetical protein [Rubellicoccus peritrichatus]|uniref:DUF4430 domain-containing protein n=1 Tax=Rubellicoccus peritrichatus TaxID=3080537 RepID=A0AAQ3QRZ4_9BACT|nr:hypothetical protein [Puniceicoccus sp. CR14]WOO39796.1 hypothetical protein RZN69_14320 [Puniceicoccus sp. CR14]
MKIYKYFFVSLLLSVLFSKSVTANWSLDDDCMLNIKLIELDDTLLLLTMANFNVEELFDENTGANFTISSEPHLQLAPGEFEIELNDENRTDVLIYDADFDAELPAVTSSIGVVFDKTYHTDTCAYLTVSLDGKSISIIVDDEYPKDGTKDIGFLALSKDYDLNSFDSEISDFDEKKAYAWSDAINDQESIINFSIIRIRNEEEYNNLVDVVNEVFEGSRDLDAVNAALADAYNAAPTSQHYISQWMYGGGFDGWVYSHLNESWAYPAFDAKGNIAFLYLPDQQQWVFNQ